MKRIVTAAIVAAFTLPVFPQGNAGAKKPQFGIAPPPRTAQARPEPPQPARPRPAPPRAVQPPPATKKVETKTYAFKGSGNPSGGKPGVK